MNDDDAAVSWSNDVPCWRVTAAGPVLLTGDPVSRAIAPPSEAWRVNIGPGTANMPKRVTVGHGSSERVTRFVDNDGEPPPLVPTPDAVAIWGPFWWVASGMPATLDVVWVDGSAEAYFYTGHDEEFLISDDDCRWLGPVLERPIAKEG